MERKPTKIFYKKGFKYQTVADHRTVVDIKPPRIISNHYIRLDTRGVLTIKDGYSWDGASGPAIDTASFMRASLVHDALYQLMREELLDGAHRKEADKTMLMICRQDGMSWLRANNAYLGVRLFAKSASSPRNRKDVQIAP